MKKVLIVVSSIWLVIIVSVLVGRLFSTEGLLIVLLSFLGLLIIVTVYDLLLLKKLSSFFKRKPEKGEDYEKLINDILSFKKKPLTKKESFYADICLGDVYIAIGEAKKAEAILNVYPLEREKNPKKAESLLSLRKDLSIVTGDKETYLTLCEKEKDDKRFIPDEANKKADLFYFSLLEGFVDSANEEEALETLKEYASESKVEEAFYLYNLHLVKKIRHQDLGSEEELKAKAEGTFIARLLDKEEND